MGHSSESRPKTEAPHEQRSQELDRMASIIAGTLIQLFGDEEGNQAASVADCSSSVVMMRKKKKNAYGDTANGAEMASVERRFKKRRFRSIDNLYMATKPIHFWETKL